MNILFTIGLAYFFIALGVFGVYKCFHCQILDNCLRLREKGFTWKAAWFCAWHTKC